MAAELGPAELAGLSEDYETVPSTDTSPFYFFLADTGGDLVPELGDERVRRAISLAIDREGVNQALFQGGALATRAFWPEGSPFYEPDVDELGYDPERAP